MRWFHPEKGELRPDEFIPVAEETGAIITLGNWITAQAAKAAAQWPEDVTIAVNLSPVQIKAPGAALGILTALREAGLDPRRLELEITETVLLDDSQNTENFIDELAAAGVRFALDDFGTGYSSLGYLNKYPFSKIKVDRSFVSGINQSARRATRSSARSPGMGATLGMEIVAEGLETIEQVRAVREAGCTLGQGYYFSRAGARLPRRHAAGAGARDATRKPGWQASAARPRRPRMSGARVAAPRVGIAGPPRCSLDRQRPLSLLRTVSRKTREIPALFSRLQCAVATRLGQPASPRRLPLSRDAGQRRLAA